MTTFHAPIFATLTLVTFAGCGMNAGTFDGIVSDHDAALTALRSTVNTHASDMSQMKEMAQVQAVEQGHAGNMVGLMSRLRSVISRANSCQPRACAGEVEVMDAIGAEVATHQGHMEQSATATEAAAEEARHTAAMDEMMGELDLGSSRMHEMMCQHMQEMMGQSSMMGGSGQGSMMGGGQTPTSAPSPEACTDMHDDEMMAMPCADSP